MTRTGTIGGSRAPASHSLGSLWLLWIGLAAMPWLQPLHGEPWTAFYSEAMAAAAMLVLAVWAWLLRPGPWAGDALAAGLLLLTAVPLAQAALGLIVLGGEAWLISSYLLGVAAAVWVGIRAQQIVPWRLMDASWAAIAVAGFVSTGLALYQWLGQDWMGAGVHFPLVGGRAYANLGQPNNLATLLCWSVIAVWWAHARGKLGMTIGVVASAFLLLGVALTRSRTGWAEVGLLASAGLYARRRYPCGPGLPVLLALLIWFALVAIGLDGLSQWWWGELPAGLRDQASAGKRPLIWQLAIAEIAQRPWLGYGWNQGVPAHLSVAERFADLHIAIQHAHNVLLDLMVWNGLPLGSAIVVGLCWWGRNRWRECTTPQQGLLLLGLAVLLVHASLELPHVYLYFLLPAALMMGTLSAIGPARTVMHLPRAVFGGVIALIGTVTVICVHDYGRTEDDLMAARMRAAEIHNPHPIAPARPLVLGFLHTSLERLRLAPTREMSDEALDQLRHTITRYPSLGGLFRYAQGSALRGRPDEARWALERVCLLNTRRDCASALQEWRDIAARDSLEMNVVVLPSLD